MNKTEVVINLFVIFQLINTVVFIGEKDSLFKEWRETTLDKRIGRVFFMFLPTLVIMSLLYRPL